MIIPILKEIPLFNTLSKNKLDELIKESTNKISIYNEKDFIVMQGDICRSVYILYKGKVKAQMENKEGKLLTIETLNAPVVLASAFIYATENRFPVNVVAISECEVLILDRNYFLDFMHRNQDVMKLFIQDISDRSKFLSSKLNEFAMQNLRKRIINYIKQYGYIKNQQAAALNLGVARPSLVKVLTEMIEERILEKSDIGIILVNNRIIEK